MRSIRIFLIVVLISTITLVTFVAALRGYQASLRQAELQFDAELMQQLHLIGDLVDAKAAKSRRGDIGNYRIDPQPYLHLTVFGEEYQTETAFQVWGVGGELLLKSGAAPQFPLAELRAGFTDVNLQGYRWRALADFNATKQLWIVVAERHDIRYALADSIILESLLPLVVWLPLLALLIWAIVSFGLKPITALAAQIREKEVTDLSPIGLNNVPAELLVLARSANELFRRLADSFAREKRFTADAAHELRNPIAALKIHSANLLAETDPPSDTALQLSRGIDRLSRLVEQMLTLNRVAPDHYMAQLSCLDLHDAASRIIADIYPELQKKQLSIELEGDRTLLFGDPLGIEILLQNLLGNAGKYTPAGGEIKVRVGTENGAPVLRISDTGPGIPEHERVRVFDRFYRVGGDRHASNTVGSGLGLSIVRQIIELHGARIELGDAAGGGLQVSVYFPQSAQCEDPPAGSQSGPEGQRT